MKRSLRIIMALFALTLMLAGLSRLTTQASAAVAAGGTCGENVTWELTDDGVLTISGTGPMADYASASSCPWYSHREAVKTVLVEDGVTAVGDRAFYNCTSLVELQLGSDVATIGTYTFRGCTKLTEITLPAAVTELKASAFRESSALSHITLVGNAPTAGSYAFANCASSITIKYYEGSTGFDASPWTNFTHITMHVGQWIVDVEATCEQEGSRHIDCAVCEKTITEVISSHHYDSGICTVCGVAETIAFGTYGTNINWKLDARGILTISGTGAIDDSYGSSAPWYNYRNQVTDVFIEEGVTEIGAYSFSGCSALTNIIIPESVTSIGSCAFYGCSSLTSITIPNSVTRIGNGAFYGCSRLESITIPFVGTRRKTASSSYQYPFGYIFGTSSYSGAVATKQYYYGSSASSTTYDTYYIPSSLKSVTVTGGEILYGAFYGCSNLTSITIADGVTAIGSLTFYKCSSLTSVTIADSVTSIGNHAFHGCSRLESITIPFVGESRKTSADTWQSPLGWIFGSTSYSGGVATQQSYYGANTTNTTTETYYIPESLKSVTVTGGAILYGAFYNCAGLTNVILSDGVTSVGNYAFYNCTELASVAISQSITQIGNYAFYKCSDLADITISGGVTSIGFEAFSGCSSLTSITLPDSVTSIGGYAFVGCRSLTSITIPDSVTSIDSGAFSNCSSLLSIDIPHSVTSIGNMVLHGCSSLESITIPFVGGSRKTASDTNQYPLGYIFGAGSYTGGVATQQSYYGASTSSTTSSTYYIPASLKHVTVTGGNVLRGAFYGCSGLVSVTLGEKVTSVAGSAFYGCSMLESLTVPFVGGSRKTASDTYQYPLGYIFGTGSYTGGVATQQSYYGTSTSSTTSSTYYIPASLKHVTVTGGNVLHGAFYGCSGLVSVTLGKKVTSVAGSAFYGCSMLESLTVPFVGGSRKTASDTYQYPLGYIFGTSSYSGGVATKQYYYGSSTSSTTSSTYYIPSSLKSVTVTGGEILYGAFYGCSSLTSITIPESVTGISSYAFYGCSSLTSITIPDRITSIGSYAFYGCSSLTSITIPECVTGISSYTFYNCSSLTSVTIPESVNSIGAYAFRGCGRLTSITIPESVTSIGTDAFSYCSSLNSVYISTIGAWCEINFSSSSSNPLYYAKNLYLNGELVTDLVIPESVNSIGAYAFYNCSSLTGITIPGGVTSIGSSAFSDCGSLTSITLPEGVTSIGDGAFRRCSSLTSITLPGGVTSIGSSAFSGCSSLTSITIPENVTSIGASAFSNCSSLTSITIPENVASIGAYAFSCCSSLTGITIPEGITSIGSYAFSDCSSLTSITLPESVTGISSYTFDNCSSLTSVTIPERVTTISSYAFRGCSSLTSITIPESVTSIGTYAFYGCSSLESITLPDSVTGISSYTFYNCSSLTSVTIPERVTTISSYAFRGCSSLTSITIPESVTSIGTYAFYGCSSLTSITIPESVTGISSYTFYNCSSLTSISLPESVTSIGGSAFSSCSSLTSITIPESITSIGDSAFSGCTGLTSITLPESITSIGKYTFSGCAGLTSISISDSVTAINSSAFSNCSSLRHVAYTSTQEQWNKISIGNYNSNLTGATFHYETRFEEMDNCMQTGIYCPVCQQVVSAIQKEGATHSYTDLHDLSCNACDFSRTLTGIAVSQQPEKQLYVRFEELDVTGGMITITFDDGSAGEISMTSDMVEAFSASIIGTQQVTIQYNGHMTAFTVEVVARIPDSVELLTKPDQLSYVVGDTLDLTGLTLKAVYGDQAEIITGADVTVQADTSSVGVKEVFASFNGKTVSFDIYVHECNLVTVDSSLYPESSHNYTNNLNEAKTLTVPGATKLVLTFDSNSNTENNCDYVYILDGTGKQLGMYSGSLANKIVTVPGDTVQIRLTSDGSAVRYGYKFSSIVAEVGMRHPEVIVPGVAPDCTEPGVTDSSYCQICGQVLIGQQVIPAEGHDYVNFKCSVCGHLSEKAVASVDGVYYESFDAALAAAGEGSVLCLVKDLVVDTLVVNSGVTLDLKGHRLQVDSYAVVFGQVCDSTEGEGLLAASRNGVLLQGNNSQLALYDTNAGAYRFFTYSIDIKGSRLNSDGTVAFGFRFDFVNEAGYELLLNSDDTGLVVEMELDWDGAQLPQIYRLTPELLKIFAQKTLTFGTAAAFFLNVSGTETLDSGVQMRMTPSVLGDHGIGKTAEPIFYTIP